MCKKTKKNQKKIKKNKKRGLRPQALMPEWSKGADLRSAIFGCVGSNPTQCTVLIAQLVRATVL